MNSRNSRAHLGWLAILGVFASGFLSGRGSVPMTIPAIEIAIVGSPQSPRAAFLAQVAREYAPRGTHIVVGLDGPGANPLLRGRTPLGGEPTAYVCANGQCRFPTTDPERLVREIKRTSPY